MTQVVTCLVQFLETMKTRIAFLIGGSLLLSLAAPETPASAADSKLVLHEWGTFTSLQDESGRSVGGINTDDEPVPHFVHQLDPQLLLSPNDIRNRFDKGAPHGHPDATMRLETPVIYFHLPQGGSIRTLDVEVGFRGGWLTEFYPHARAAAPGIEGDRRRFGLYRFGPITPKTFGSLQWNGLQVGGNWGLTNTSDRVWTAPRAVDASLVRATNNEAEKFLFYRGIGNLDAPLRVSRDLPSGQLVIRGQFDLPSCNRLAISKLWLVDIRPDGNLAYRVIPGFDAQPHSTRFLGRTAGSFPEKDYSAGNLRRLRRDLRRALVADGLFADEADSLLNTWQLSYFKSEGMRLFFLVPREWTDHVLPLKISEPAQVTRVMVGRIELVTSTQQKLLATIASYSPATVASASSMLAANFNRTLMASPHSYAMMARGSGSMASHFKVPAEYQAYLDLGRFRNALVLHAAQHPATAPITNFIFAFRLSGYDPTLAGQPQ
ncbi:MAG TPA: hypothetical protein VEH04_16375 [Verrucomicrobiae bacterium]|nr:hypothetical protein [Verrucomicrobiae bacterium]